MSVADRDVPYLGQGAEQVAVPPPVPEGLLARALATLDPGYFAWVMASGIVSVGTGLLGYWVLSAVVLWVAVAAFCGLVLAYIARALWWPSFFQRSLEDPSVALAYFTFVAGADVLGVRFVMAHRAGVSAGLGLSAAVAWAVLNYGLPWSVVARAHRPVLRDFNGTWLIWVVGTQSLSIVAASLAPSASTRAQARYLAEASTCLWGVGVVLYIVLVTIIVLRLMVVEVTPREMGPAYWIAMGATAISVRAAAGLLALPGSAGGFPTAELRPFVLGFSVVLWSFGSWWIPALVLFGLWRHLLRHFPLTYEPRLWSMVFPLGMYTVASYTLGRAGRFTFMVTIAKIWVWVAVAAWAGVLVLMALALARALAAAYRRRAARPATTR